MNSFETLCQSIMSIIIWISQMVWGSWTHSARQQAQLSSATLKHEHVSSVMIKFFAWCGELGEPRFLCSVVQSSVIKDFWADNSVILKELRQNKRWFDLNVFYCIHFQNQTVKGKYQRAKKCHLKSLKSI